MWFCLKEVVFWGRHTIYDNLHHWRNRNRHDQSYWHRYKEAYSSRERLRQALLDLKRSAGDWCWRHFTTEGRKIARGIASRC